MIEGHTSDNQDSSNDEVYESEVGKAEDCEYSSGGEEIYLIRNIYLLEHVVDEIGTQSHNVVWHIIDHVWVNDDWCHTVIFHTSKLATRQELQSIIDGGSSVNIPSLTILAKASLKTEPHTNPYKVY